METLVIVASSSVIGFILGIAVTLLVWQRHEFREEEFRRGKHSLSRIDEER